MFKRKIETYLANWKEAEECIYCPEIRKGELCKCGLYELHS